MLGRSWFMASFLYCFPYSYHSLEHQQKVTVIFSLSPLRARKSDIYCYCNNWKSNNFRERAIKKRSKELILKRMQSGLRVITQGLKECQEGHIQGVDPYSPETLGSNQLSQLIGSGPFCILLVLWFSLNISELSPDII